MTPPVVDTADSDLRVDAGSTGDPASSDGSRDDAVPGGVDLRRVVSWAITAVAGVLVLFALLLPNEMSRLTPGEFVRIPVEAVLGIGVLLVLPSRARLVLAPLVGAALGVLTIVKVLDIGFLAALDRPFNPVLDWILLDDAMGLLMDSTGRGGAIGAAVAAVLAAAALPVVLALAVRRLTRLATRHSAAAIPSVTAFGAVWITCLLLGTQIVPGVPVATDSAANLAYERGRQVGAGLRDRQAFADQADVDAFRDTPGEKLLTGLRGKDVIVAFVESYGRDAVEEPEFESGVGAVLDDGNRRLSAAGYSSRSAFLTSPTAGGGSWLAHGTLLSGLWVNNEQRHRTLLSSDRMTLNAAFRRANWRTVGVMPAITRPWPEGAFFGYDKFYDSRTVGYRGPNFSYATMPDQYTLSAFQRSERAKPDHAPVMAEIALVSSHTPWTRIPRLVDWEDVGDGTIFGPMAKEGDPTDVVWKDPARVRTQYRKSIEYSLNSLISYVEKYGDDDLVLVFLGDHQPAPIVTGTNASRDVPITIVARDKAVLDRISGWGWQDGLQPGPKAPVWPMDDFRDRFLTAYQR